MSLIALVLSSIAFAQNAAENNIAAVRESDKPPSESIAAIVLWCQPENLNLKSPDEKLVHLEPNFRFEAHALADALKPRNDVDALWLLENPTSEEIASWMAQMTTALNGAKYKQVIIGEACLSADGDTDEERMLTREMTSLNDDGLPFYDFATWVGSVALSEVWFIDASRDFSTRFNGTPTLGPTADDIVTLGLPDAFAISTGWSGRYADGGLLSAVARGIIATEGGPITLDTLYYEMIKPSVPRLELATTLDLSKNWVGEREVLPGGGLRGPPMLTQTTPTPPDLTRHTRSFGPNHALLLSGGVTLIGSGVFGALTLDGYRLLTEYNKNGGESQNELNKAVADFRRDRGFSIGLGATGAVLTTWGVVNTVRKHDNRSVTFIPTGIGAAATGSF